MKTGLFRCNNTSYHFKVKVALTFNCSCHLLFGICVGACHSGRRRPSFWELKSPLVIVLFFVFFDPCQLCCPKAPAFSGMWKFPGVPGSAFSATRWCCILMPLKSCPKGCVFKVHFQSHFT